MEEVVCELVAVQNHWRCISGGALVLSSIRVSFPVLYCDLTRFDCNALVNL